jgi:hypothetical protein
MNMTSLTPVGVPAQPLPKIDKCGRAEFDQCAVRQLLMEIQMRLGGGLCVL